MNILNNVATSDRLHIGFFGLRNAGKSSIVNAITNQEMSIVSSVKGTTNDPVTKSMEILPLGAVVIIDTPGFDDEDENLASKRIQKTKEILDRTDIAVLIVDSTTIYKENIFLEETTTEDIKNILKQNQYFHELIQAFDTKNIPYIIALNKCDLFYDKYKNNIDEFNKKHLKNVLWTTAFDKEKIEDLKNVIASARNSENNISLVEGIVKENDLVILVTPIDESAPKGRLILPQVKTLRDVLDKNACALVVKDTELKNVLDSIGRKPDLVITDSQVFDYVDKVLDKDIPLTSFSILLAKEKGFLDIALESLKKINELNDGDYVLIAEACTHHRQCNDIGTVQIPKLLKKMTSKNINVETISGNSFPNDLSKYKMIIHCGGCMINDREMKSRIDKVKESQALFINYGIFLAYAKGILDRCIKK